MAKYVFPAVFTPEEKGYYIHFPDLEACFTQGNDLVDGTTMAEDVLCLTLYDMEEEGKAIPQPSHPKAIKLQGDEFVVYVSCDTLEYRKFYNNAAVKKTLTIPSWLNDMAMRENVNFSGILQQALQEYLHVER